NTLSFPFCFLQSTSSFIYTLSLHDALPIFQVKPFIGCPFDCTVVKVKTVYINEGAHGSLWVGLNKAKAPMVTQRSPCALRSKPEDRKSTRLNSVTSGSRMPSSA